MCTERSSVLIGEIFETLLCKIIRSNVLLAGSLFSCLILKNLNLLINIGCDCFSSSLILLRLRLGE